ncbi:hypothetical protein N7530_007861 [Penicillium desertorum]|uniref:Uncharacterized protein n=1 Tax=Penicillium desertorum TaxID=1303715 RepID=A0A9W9WN20_9EURO|nr:hypothetical protein N7530_007861 [Penicillium desertorum]
MANQQGPARCNGVIGFQMAGAPTPAIPLVAPCLSPPLPNSTRVPRTGSPPPPRGGPRHSPFFPRQGLQYALQKDRYDIQDLRQIVAAAEFNLQRQQRLAGAEDRLKGLAKNLDLMLAAAMQATRESQVRTRSAPTAESSTHLWALRAAMS